MERLCIRYSGLICTHIASNYNRLNAVLSDAPLRGGYIVEHLNFVGEDGCSLNVDEGTSAKKRADRLSSQEKGNDDCIEIVMLLTSPLTNMPYDLLSVSPFYTSFPCYSFSMYCLLFLCLYFNDNGGAVF